MEPTVQFYKTIQFNLYIAVCYSVEFYIFTCTICVRKKNQISHRYMNEMITVTSCPISLNK